VLSAALEDLRRVHRIASVLTRHGFSEVAGRLWSKVGRGAKPESISRSQEQQGERTRRALPPEKRFCLVLEELGPTFIKLGQVLSTRHDLLPGAYIRELSRLQDKVEALPFEDIEAEIERSLGRPVAEVFRDIDPVPLATASIAQVHKATLADGSPVVVKVQRPGTAETIISDLDVLYGVARMLDATVAEAREYDPLGIVAQFDRGLREELDYRLEARNTEAIRRSFAEVDWLVVPKCYRDASSQTVLTQQRIHGRSLHEAFKDESFDRARLVERLAFTAFKMVFEDGFFHADPHPGNILELEDGRMALLDFGLVGRVSATMRESLIRLALGIFTRDVPSLARFFVRLGQGNEPVDIQQFRREIEALLEHYLGLQLGEIDTRSLISDLFDVALRYRIRVPPEYALLVKTVATLEGVVRTADPNLDLLAATRPYAQRLLTERYGPQGLATRATKLGVGLGGLIQDLPLDIEQALMDLQAGRLQVQIRSEDLRELSDRINGLGTRIFLGVLAGSVLLSTTVVFSRFPVEVLGPRSQDWVAWIIGTLVTLGLTSLAALIGTAATWHLSATRFSKLKLRSIFTFWRWLFAKRKPD